MSAACELDGQDKQQRERERGREREGERERQISKLLCCLQNRFFKFAPKLGHFVSDVFTYQGTY